MRLKLDVLLALLASAISVCAFARTDDAAVVNRKWVREYIRDAIGRAADPEFTVTTNANGSLRYKSEFRCSEIPGATAISFDVSAHTNPAIRIVNQSIPQLGGVAMYAKNALGSYVNVSNAYIRSVNVTSGYAYNVSTNRYHWSPANYFHVTSNQVYRSSFTATALDGTQYRSHPSRGGYILQAVTNASWRARIFRTGCSDKTRTKLVGSALTLRKTQRNPSFLELIIPSAYAEPSSASPETQSISDDGTINWGFSISNFTVEMGRVSATCAETFSFYYSGTLPEKPSDQHEHTLDEDCNCEDYKTTYEETEEDENYSLESNAGKMSGGLKFSDWITPEEWTGAGGEIAEGQADNFKKWTISFTSSEGGIYTCTANSISNCDAFRGQLASYDAAVSNYLDKCQENYRKSQVCETAGPHHKKTNCGSTEVCTRNVSHLGPHEFSGGNYSEESHDCKCHASTEAHSKSEGSKTAKTGNTGWTRTDSCSTSGCSWSKNIDHDCKHVNCASCSAGDGCNWACPTCNGSHKKQSATESQCAYCQCEDCEHVYPSDDDHAWIDSCSHEEEGNDHPDGTAHCVCECGENGSCQSGHAHDRDTLDPYEYDQIENEDGTIDEEEHLETRSRCSRCENPYAQNQPHDYGEEGSEDDNRYYEKVGVDPNSKCAQVKICTKCDYEKHEEQEEAGDHSEKEDSASYSRDKSDAGDFCKKSMTCANPGKGGTEHTYYKLLSHETDDASVSKYEYKDDGETGCIPSKACANCLEDIPQSGVAHGLEDSPSSYKDNGDYNGSGNGCVPVKKCTHGGTLGCGHEFDQTAQAHVANTSDGCKCTNCKTYQCSHNYDQTDLCGNSKCLCGTYEKSESQRTHTDFYGTNSVHRCACGESSHSPDWGEWVEVSRSNGQINWKRTCNKCSVEETKTTDDDTGPDDGYAYPISGCCGNWRLGSSNTNGEPTFVSGGSFTNYVLQSGSDPDNPTHVARTVQRVVYFPTHHNFAWHDISPHCQSCTNINPLSANIFSPGSGAACGTNATEEAAHGFWHDSGGYCACECGYFSNLVHTAGIASNYWVAVITTNANKTVTNCTQLCQCDRKSLCNGDRYCGTVTNVVLPDHDWKVLNDYFYKSEKPETCWRRQQCQHADDNGVPYKDGANYLCGTMGETCENIAHAPLPTGIAKPIVEGGITNEYVHNREFKCQHIEGGVDRGCGLKTYESQSHNWYSNAWETTASQHRETKTCITVGTTLPGCGASVSSDWDDHQGAIIGYYANTNNFSHNITNLCATCGKVYRSAIHGCDELGGWNLTSLSNGYDIVYCSKCGNSEERNHTWSYNGYGAAGHYCANGGGHLFIRDHVWADSTSNLCVLCHFRPNEHVHACKCKCGCYTHGETYEGNCVYMTCEDGEWICGCSACKAGNKESCICHNGNFVICVSDNVVTSYKYQYEWKAGTKAILNLLDPVYHVCEGGFLGCCMSNNYLKVVGAGACTNVEEVAFKDAFRGCEYLERVDFGALREAGENSFMQAFHGCHNLENVNFSALEIAHQGAFYNAFYRAYDIYSISFPSLVTAGPQSFYRAFEHCLLREVHFNSLKSADGAFGQTFEGCDRLELVSFSNLTNGIVNLGSQSRVPIVVYATDISGTAVIDVRGCTNLRALHFENTGVIPFDSRWIPQNSDFRIYVNTNLIENWITDASWQNYVTNIVGRIPQFTPWVVTCEVQSVADALNALPNGGFSWIDDGNYKMWAPVNVYEATGYQPFRQGNNCNSKYATSCSWILKNFSGGGNEEINVYATRTLLPVD